MHHNAKALLLRPVLTEANRNSMDMPCLSSFLTFTPLQKPKTLEFETIGGRPAPTPEEHQLFENV